MRRLWNLCLSAVLLTASALLMTAPAGSTAPNQPTLSEVPRYQHIFSIVEENRGFSQIIGNPDAPQLNRIASTNTLATDYFGTSHPSEPNYVAMVGGSDFGINNDGPYTTNVVDQPSLATQLEGAGLSWKSYAQSLPTAGFTGTCFPCNASDPSTLYASKHIGFLNFKSVQSNPAEMQKNVPIEQLTTDLAQDTVPTFSLIVPDQCHDMHGTNDCPDAETNVKVGDDYAGQLVNRIMSSKTWQEGQNAIVVTFDEGTDGGGCCDANPGGGQVYTTVITNHGAQGVQYPTASNHYSMLAAIEQMYGLGCLQNTCDTANVVPMSTPFATQ